MATRGILPAAAFLLFVTLCSDLWGQTTPRFVMRHPVPQSFDLNAVAFAGEDTGIAVGDNGAVIGTTDGGAQWTNLLEQVPTMFRDVEMPDARHAFAVGFAVVYRTTDFGAHWDRLFIGGSLYDASFATPRDGMVVGDSGRVFRTTDGGDTWGLCARGAPRAKYSSVVMRDAMHAVLLRGDTKQIAYTEDGGLTWQSAVVDDTLSDAFQPRSLRFFDHEKRQGLAMGYHMSYRDGLTWWKETILKTRDGGATWTLTDTVPNAGSAAAMVRCALICLDSLRYYDWQSHGILRATWDGGGSWTTVADVPMFGNLFDMQPASATTFIAVGLNGAVARTSDAGAYWSLVSHPLIPAPFGFSAHSYQGVHFADRLNGIAVDRQCRIVRTSDGGRTWFSTRDRISPVASMYVSEEWGFAGRDTGYIVAIDAIDHSNVIFRTLDGGATWAQVASSAQYITGISCTTARQVYAFTDSGGILRSMDAGVSWTSLTTGIHDALFDVAFLDSARGFALGSSFLIRTSDGGGTWTRDGVPDGASALRFLHGAVGIIGCDGSILRSTDSGGTWSMAQNSTGGSIRCIVPAGGTTCYAAGESTVLRSTDDGATWAVIDPYTVGGPWLDAGVFPEPGHGVFVGAPSAIVTVDESTLSVEPRAVPARSAVAQLYPNPARSASTIAYDLPEPTQVTIALYTAHGALAGILFDDHQPAGRHTVPVRAAEYPPGVYHVVIVTRGGCVTGRVVITR
jgi:photosystem II stability/assembly factor-like uncharacterized protein